MPRPFVTRAVVVVLSTCVLLSSVAADTILSPRSKAEHEAELKLLQEKYGPKADPLLDQQLQQQGAVPASGTSTATNNASSVPEKTKFEQNAAALAAQRAAAANPQIKANSKLRVDLIARPGNRFAFNGKDYARDELALVLENLASQYRLDHIVLMQSDANTPIALPMQLDLAKLANDLKVPAMYQVGTQLRAVEADKPVN